MGWRARGRPTENCRQTRTDTDRHRQTRTSVAGPRALVRWVKVCKRSVAATLKGTTRVSMPASGCCERVARERAGGERGCLFAGQKDSRVHPSNKAARQTDAATLRCPFAAGRRNSKDRLQTCLHRCASGKRGSGKSEGLFPEWCAARTGGAGRSAAEPCRKAPLTTESRARGSGAA